MKPKPDHFRRQTFALFFIVSLVPALLVGSIWYVYTQTSLLTTVFVNVQSFVLPVFLVGILPAVILSSFFAELLARPIRRIHTATLELARGNFKKQFRRHEAGEFEEIGKALDLVAEKLQQTLSQASSETSLISAERNKLRGVLNSMTDGVFALDHSGRIILFNKAASEITGRSIAEVAGQLAEKVMPFRQNGELVMTRWLASQPGSGHKVGQWKGLELYRANGASLYVDVQAVVLNDDPNGISALITFHDLTKSHLLDEMKIDFVALAAHELRTPLTEIKGYLDILSHEAKNLSRSNREFLEKTINATDQLGGLMHNLLNVSRIEHGELSYNPVEIDYLDFMNDVGDEMQMRAEQQQRHLKLVLPSHLPKITADPMAMREVIVNLAQNAMQHTSSDKGDITITVEQVRSEIQTSVSDHGSGIPADAIPRLFTKFYRVNEMAATTRGTGLGLFICKSIVEAHGGHIWVESVEGEGSTFSFRLPLKQIAHRSKTEHNDTRSVNRGTHGWIKKHSVH